LTGGELMKWTSSGQGDRLGQDRPNARHGKQLLVGRRVVEVLMNGLCQRFHLLPQTIQPHKATRDREPLGLVGPPGRAVLRRQLLNPFAAEACPGIPRHDVVHTEDLGGVLTDQMGAFA